MAKHLTKASEVIYYSGKNCVQPILQVEVSVVHELNTRNLGLVCRTCILTPKKLVVIEKFR